MRLLIDMQGATTFGSRSRGIGRYTTQLVAAMARARGGRDVGLMVNANHMDDAGAARIDGLARTPPVPITRYKVPPARHFAPPESAPQRRIADAIVKRHAAALRPDVLLFTSLFEYAAEDFSPIELDRYPCKLSAVILYDLIPLVFEDDYLRNALIRNAFFERTRRLRSADLLLAISESARRDAIARLGIAPERIVNISAAVDEGFRKREVPPDRRGALAARLGLTRPFVIYVAGGDMRKNLGGAILAFAAIPEELRTAHQFLLVTNLDDTAIAGCHDTARDIGLEADGLIVARGIGDDDLVDLLNMSAALFFPSLYEGFGLPVLEAMHCGVPLVAGDNSSIPEIVDRQDILFNARDPGAAAQALARVLSDEALRRDVAAWGPRRARMFSWERSAALALDAMEARFAAAERSRPHALAGELLDRDGARAELADILVGAPDCDPHIETFVADLMVSAPACFEGGLRRLLVDVTDCRRSEAWSGIQRVVRKLVAAFYDAGAAAETFIALAVRLDEAEPRSAPDFVAGCMGRGIVGRSYPIDIRPGDDLFMLDSNWIDYPTYVPLFESVRRQGGRILTCIYDIIPELHPDVCGEGMPEAHARWLHAAVACSDGLLCISRAVADEVIAYVGRLGLPHRPSLKVGWFHCGSDIHGRGESYAPQPHVRAAFDGRRPTFLTVGTLEPRKCHALALDAFERLWDRGVDASLCFIGARGWKIEALEARIRSHVEHGRRLFWFADARDGDVAHAYEHAAAIVCMSMAEGFGLPIVEAARLGRTVICSDIPVFREVGRDGALYFRLGDARSLADTVAAWLDGAIEADASKVSRNTWEDAARRIRDIVYGDDWYATLP